MSNTTATLPHLLVKNTGEEKTEKSRIITEHTLRININDVPTLSITCTDSHLLYLILGALFSNHYAQSPEDESTTFSADRTEAWVTLMNAAPSANTALSTLPSHVWKDEWVFALTRKFAEGMPLHKETQGTHSCILAQGDTILFYTEDISRHNAVDKIIGYTLFNDIDRSQTILYSSGRVPYDMAEKVIRAGIPVLVSKSVPTKQAVELAKQYGLTLICRAHTDSFEVFAGEDNRA